MLTPSKWMNSQGYLLTPSFARNTDGIDPGSNNIAFCGVLACNTVSTGDDHMALKGGHWVSDLIIAHNHFGTGHGMSIGSETYGSYTSPDGVQHLGVENIQVYDLTIDADSRPVGVDAQLPRLQRHPHQVRLEPRGPGQQRQLPRRLHARHGQRDPGEHRLQPALRRHLLPPVQEHHLPEHPPRDLHGAAAAGGDAGGLQRHPAGRADHARQRHHRQHGPAGRGGGVRRHPARPGQRELQARRRWG